VAKSRHGPSLLREPRADAIAHQAAAGQRGELLTEAWKPGRHGRKRLFLVIQIVVSLGVVLGIFAGVLPKIADYSAVWGTIRSLTWFELLGLLAITTLHGMAVWPQLVASLPGLTLAQAAVNNQASTTVTNTLPAGGMLAVGVSYAMCRSWGFADSAIALSVLITFVWNTLFKLTLPVVALALLAIQGKGSGGLIVASLVGLAILAVAVAVAVTMRWKTRLAGQMGSLVGSVASLLRKVIRKPPIGDWAEVAVRFRGEGAGLIAARWVALTLSTVASHLGLYLVLGADRSRRGDLRSGGDLGSSPWCVRLRPPSLRTPHHPGGLGDSRSWIHRRPWCWRAGIKPPCRWLSSTPRSPPPSWCFGPSRTAFSFRMGHSPTSSGSARRKSWRKASPHGPPAVGAPAQEAASESA